MLMVTRDHLKLNRESGVFIKEAVLAIGAHWDATELLERATPHFRAMIKEADLRAEFAAAGNALGSLVEYRAVGAKVAFQFVPTSTPATADYIVRAAFAKGEADIEIHAVRTGSVWRIDGFTIGGSPEMRQLLGMQG
jgi:hypothetical protein